MRKATTYRNQKAQRKSIKERVFNFILKNEKIHTKDIISKMRLKHQTVTARLSELEQEGLIYQICEHLNNEPFTFWQITPAELIEPRKVENRNKRHELWVAKGLKKPPYSSLVTNKNKI